MTNGDPAGMPEAAQSVMPPKHCPAGACRGSDDDNVLDCLIASGADYLVTGDAELLELKTFGGKPILTPSDFEMLFSSTINPPTNSILVRMDDPNTKKNSMG
jgi:predicted nucleic acid-binding protein